MENNEIEDRVEKAVKTPSLRKTFDKVFWFACSFVISGLVSIVYDWVKGNPFDLMKLVGPFVWGVAMLLVYSIINHIVNRSPRFASLDDNMKDEKKGQLCFLAIFVLFVAIFVVCGLLI